MLTIRARAACSELRSSIRPTAATTSSWPGTLPRAVCPQGSTAPAASAPAAPTATEMAYQRQPAGWLLTGPQRTNRTRATATATKFTVTATETAELSGSSPADNVARVARTATSRERLRPAAAVPPGGGAVTARAGAARSPEVTDELSGRDRTFCTPCGPGLTPSGGAVAASDS